ncbi:DegQ family serine endoprotease [Reinekea marina]|uniref:Probable periplasmic serine endoprotease DegP-like n=1 Tax=Reinekea marina TaxID=1310421 RepID=A0ABV7WUR5_9GAMM|nr:DegQ family serine endoprotease [Reinekea marina]MDN3650127.1 DegQ family serine endoprotease [Reinekea marina]
MAKRLILLINLQFISASMTYALSSGLPDFTQLVEDQSPSVVKISTQSTRKAVAQGREDVPELFRYFFGDQLPDDFNYNQPQPSQGLGSGFIYSEDGYILTNNHVVEGADKITVRLTNGDEYEAELIGADSASDVAVLKVEGDDLPAVTLGDSDALKVGEWVLAIGSPFNFEYSVTAGIVSAKGRALGGNDRYVPFIQTDVAINPGNSGGPLFNLDGDVVGINSQIYTRSGGFMGVSFAIPINIAMSVAEQLVETGEVQRGWLGVEMYAAFNDDLELAKSLGLERAEGALVARVFNNSPADKAGLQANDVIIELNGNTVQRYSDLPPLVGAIKPGETVEATILRDGKERKVSVTIGVLNESSLASSSAVNPEADNPLNIVVRDAGGKNGVLVEQVLEGPAKRAGMRANDIITMMRNEFVRTKDDFDRIMSELPANGAVAVRIIRGNSIVYLAIPIK